ncbi:MAG: para-nitrobenzyl esterase [Saprospiraceae bacterium]|jgi:para-nitrobenzyl esterase
MKKIIYLLLFLTSFQLTAQNHPTCDGNRYRSDVFENFTETTALKYGEGTTFAGNFQELFLDVYEPEGDTETLRPLIILAFGGSFIGGERADMVFLCEAYAKKGYVAATIDYRLYDGPLFPIPSGADMTDVVIKSISDMKAAIRYMREDAATTNLYKIDPDNVFVGGISAGSITAAHTAVIDSTDSFTDELLAILEANGGWEGNSSDNFEYSSDVQGYINFSGGLNDASWLDETDPPFMSVHDDMDEVVPYGEGFASIFGFDIIYLEGSQIMHQEADTEGVMNTLYTIENSNGHVSYMGSAAGRTENINRSADFLYELLCADYVSGIEDEYTELKGLSISPNPTSGLINLKNETSQILNSTIFNTFGQNLGTWENASQIDLSNLGNGIYFLEIINEASKEKTVTRIVVK